MDLIWSYVLILVIILVLIAIRLLNNKILDEFMVEHDTAKKYLVFKKDFFWTVTKISVVCTILINGLMFYGHQRINYQSIMLTLLIIMMCILSGISFVAVDEKKAFNIAGYNLEENQIKDIKIKKRKNRLDCTILFKEEMNGYQGMEFYVFDKEKEEFFNKIKDKSEN